MNIRDFIFRGHFQEQDAESAEPVQIVVPANDVEQNLISWAILANPQTVSDDSSRRDYVFHYELGAHTGDGEYVLKLSCRDASGVRHSAEIAAALVVTPPSVTDRLRRMSFEPFWFISRKMHFKPTDGDDRHYHGQAYGALTFLGTGNLPHRRLFGATV